MTGSGGFGRRIASLAIAGMGLTMIAADHSDPDRRAEREALVAGIAQQARGFPEIAPRGLSPEVLAALRQVPRHEFVPPEQVASAYHDRPLPIGLGQTISQPSLVAFMTELLKVRAGSRVLEVGTGSGWQAALLAALGAEVYSIEIVAPLAVTAEARLARLGYRVTVRAGDGYRGWPEHAPFDAIIVTAGAPRVPPPLVEQLKRGGRLVIPVDAPGGWQQLWLIEKRADGTLDERSLMDVAFVPLTGEH